MYGELGLPDRTRHVPYRYARALLAQMVGLLDFGDALRGALVQDVAISIAYASQHGEVPNLLLAAAIVRGYAAGRAEGTEPLSSSERALLFPLMLGRLTTTILMGEARCVFTIPPWHLGCTTSPGGRGDVVCLLPHLADLTSR